MNRNPYFDGAYYFYAVVELIDPDNGKLIDNTHNKLCEFNAKSFGYIFIQILVDFKNLKTRIKILGGMYDVDDHFLDF